MRENTVQIVMGHSGRCVWAQVGNLLSMTRDPGVGPGAIERDGGPIPDGVTKHGPNDTVVVHLHVDPDVDQSGECRRYKVNKVMPHLCCRVPGRISLELFNPGSLLREWTWNMIKP